MQSVHAPGAGGRVMCFCGRAARTWPYARQRQRQRVSSLAASVGHHAHRVHDDVKPASRLFVCLVVDMHAASQITTINCLMHC